MDTKDSGQRKETEVVGGAQRLVVIAWTLQDGGFTGEGDSRTSNRVSENSGCSWSTKEE